MAHGNTRAEERFELSLGGFQIAGIVVGALAALSLVFFLGFLAGRSVGERRAQSARPAGLPELDAAASAEPPAPVSPGDMTFAQELPKAKPPAPPPPAKPAPPPAPPDATDEASAPKAQAAEKPDAAPESQAGWSVQLGAAQTREEAEALVARVRGLGPRIEEADVPGKGHWFRVRAGRFESRAAADKYRLDVVRETGIAAVVVPAGN